MAVTRCSFCGDLYLVDVDRCTSCGGELVEVGGAHEDSGSAAGEPAPAASDRHELHEWTMEGRRLLDGMLDREGIPRSWQGSTLLTPAAQHDLVADLVAGVAERDARTGAEEEPADVDADEHADDDLRGWIGYDLGEWNDLARGDLVAALADAGIEHAWDEDGDLLVAGPDEERVDAIFERLVGGDDDAEEDLPGEDDDGLLVQETLSDLFVGADRLAHNPLDATASRLVLDARDTARSLRLPFGFDAPQWRRILVAADDLASSFEPGEIDDDAIRERAALVRGLLRDVV